MRMLLIMAVSLYTSRIILSALGVVDWGIYSVVGGFVSMFGFMNNAMASASQRFLSFEIGKKNDGQLANVFMMSVNIQVILAAVILILAETVGLWFVNTQLTIPPERLEAANWVYQFSMLAFIVNIASVTSNASIIAHERMKVFAIVSVVEVMLRLLIVFMIQYKGFDRLTFYAILMFVITLIIRSIYMIYCRRHFPESNMRFFWDKKLLKTIMSYSVWSFWGSLAGMLYGQGINVLLNLFFGPVVNAARGIAYQVKANVDQFVSNFQMAMNPQIVKSFAAGDLTYMHQLICRGAKYSFFLLYAISLPLILEMEAILSIWLKEVPDYTVIFARLVLIHSLVDCFSGTLVTSAQASGKIRLYQTLVGSLLIMNLPVSFLFLKVGGNPESTFYISICIAIVALFTRLALVKGLVHLSVTGFLRQAILPSLAVVALSGIFPVFTCYLMPYSLTRLLLVCFISVLSVGLSISVVGLSQSEKTVLFEKIKSVLLKSIGEHKAE